MLFLFLRLTLEIVLATAKDLSFSQIIETNQYLIVSQQNCLTTFESHVENSCPRALFQASGELQLPSVRCDFPIRVHILRDPERRRPPRALYVGRDRNKKTIAFVDDLKVPYASLYYTSRVHPRIIDFGQTPHLYLDRYNTEFTVFDNMYQLLYLVNTDSGGTQRCAVLRLSNLFPSNNAKPDMEKRFIHEFQMHVHNKARSDWTEDPYRNEVYYTITNGGMTSIYVLPLNRLLSAFQEGTHGKRVFFYDSSQRTLVSITYPVVLTQHSQDGRTTVYIRSMANSDNTTNTGISCGLALDRMFPDSFSSISFMVVRDWDYCQLRDGASANPVQCQQERNQWLKEQGLKTDSRDWWFLFIVVVLIILATILLLLLLYICWLRRNLDDSFEEVSPRNRYYPPPQGPYPDMDISVDRWNY